MSLHSIIEHRANYHFLKLEEDYVLICSQGKQYPHCKAFILAILEHWTNDKLSKGQSPRIYMTYPQWIDALYGLFRRNHVIDCLAELIQENLISRQPCRLHGKDTFEYSLNVQEVQVRLSKLAERTEKYTRPNINPFKFKRVEKQTGVNLDGNTDPNLNGSERDDPSKFGHNIDSSTEIPSDINSEREGADAPAHAEISSEVDLEKTEKRRAAQKEEAHDRHQHTDINPIVDHHLSPSSFEPSKATDAPTLRQDHNMGTQPPLPRKPRANTVPKRPRPQQQELTDEIPGPEIPEKAVAIMDRWDRVHKKPAPRTIKTIQAAQLLMVYDPSEDELRECEKWLYTTDRPGKPWYRSHGVHLPDIAEKIGSWQSLQNAPPAKPEKEPSNEHKATQQPANAFIERCLDKDYNKRQLEKMRAENERRRQAQAGGVQ